MSTAWIIGRRCLVALSALVISAGQLTAQSRGYSADSTDAVGVVNRFHSLLGSGDSTGVVALLAPDAMILESGGIETVEQYRSRHLAADIRASAGSKSTRTVSQVIVHGDAAWVVSTSTTQREANGTTSTSTGAELMVLKRTSAGWRVAAIHWSSRARRG
jgi:hypothetical protein